MKKLLSVVLLIVFTVTFVACASSGKTRVTLEEYNATVSEFNNDLMEEATKLSNLAKFEHGYWSNMEKMGSYVDVDKIPAHAYEWLEKSAGITKIDVEQGYEDICDRYKELVNTEVRGGGNEKVAENIDDMFEAYNSLYLLVNSPQGSSSDFGDRYNTYAPELSNKHSAIEILVSE